MSKSKRCRVDKFHYTMADIFVTIQIAVRPIIGVRNDVPRECAPLAIVAALAGCTDLKPTQASVDELKSQVSALKSSVGNAESSAQAASAAASRAGQASGNAQSKADQAKSNQTGIEAINEKIDRMFKKSVSKCSSIVSSRRDERGQAQLQREAPNTVRG